MPDQPTDIATTPAPAVPAMPLFYSRPRPLEPAVHGQRRLRENPSFGFAAHANSVPLNGAEFGAALRHYPIVFAGSPIPFPTAVLGLRKDENLFIDANGRWTDGTYVPAYIRRYPFLFIEAPGDRLILAIDEASGFLVDDGNHRLFDDEGKPTALINGALQFCGGFQQSHKATLEFCQALVDEQMLVENQANAQLPSGEKLSIGGFRIIDEKKINALPAATLAHWRDKGWLAWSYAHLISLASWNLLAPIAGKRGTTAATVN